MERTRENPVGLFIVTFFRRFSKETGERPDRCGRPEKRLDNRTKNNYNSFEREEQVFHTGPGMRAVAETATGLPLT
jgi:hypothetical protein